MKNNKMPFLAVLTLVGLMTACGGTSSLLSSSSSMSSSSVDSSSSSDISTSIVEEEMQGDGSEENPYLVKTKKHLQELSNLVCGSEVKFVSLQNDIDLSSEEWKPIGSAAAFANVVFDGNNHTISGLKINTSTAAEIDSLGLFAFATGSISNLNINGEIIIEDNKAETTIAGLLAGYATTLSVNNCHVDGRIRVLDNTASEGTQTLVGGLIGQFNADQYYYVEVATSSSSVEIETAADYLGVAGGLIGSVAFDYNSPGFVAVNSSVVDTTSIKSSAIAGGIIGSSSYYTSVVNSVVKADVIETTSSFLSTTSWTGGVVGSGYYENAALFNIVNVKEIKGLEDISSSYVGNIFGEVTEDGFADSINMYGSLEFGNISIDTSLVGSKKNELENVTLTTLTKEKLESIGFALAYDLEDGKLPILKENPTLEGTGTAKIHANNGTDAVENVDINFASFNNIETEATYQNHTLIYISYDADSNLAYRWYTPLNADIDLYNRWFDATTLEGWHLGESQYNPQMYFGVDGSLTWLYSDHSSGVGTYWTDGKYIVLNIDAYEGSIATINSDGTITFCDVNSSDYIYSYTKASVEFGYYQEEGYMIYLDGKGSGYVNDGYSLLDVTYNVTTEGIELSIEGWDTVTATLENGVLSYTLMDYDGYTYEHTLTSFNGIPDYTGKKYLGEFTGKTYTLNLEANGNLTNYKLGNDSPYGYGGYLAYGNELIINTTGIIGTYKYNPSLDVLLSKDGQDIFARTGSYETTFKTEDNSVIIHKYSDKTYLVINSNINTSTTIVGDLVDGGEISIGDSQYTISGTTLVPAVPEVDVTPLVNTYEGSVGANSIEVVLNADHTGTYAGTPITYEFDGTLVTFTVGGAEVNLTWNSENKTLIGTYDDGEYVLDVSLSVKEEPVETASLVGTWTGNVVMSVSWTFEIRGDGTLTLTVAGTDYEGTYTGDVNTSIDFEVPDFAYGIIGTITLDGEADASVDVEMDYEYYSGEFTRV